MLHLDVTGTSAKTLTPSTGIPDSELMALRTSMKRHVTDWKKETKNGEHAWTQDPYNSSVISSVKTVAKRVKTKGFETVLWIGMGGDSLGPRAIQEVFENPETLEFIVVDTIDPSALRVYESVLDWSKTFVVIGSKSGETLESMTIFFYVWELLKKKNGSSAASRVLGITDPKKGTLREFCLKEGIEMLPIPEGVGGRYCIFTPVGLLPVALLGGDVDAFVDGATDMEALCEKEVLEENPAALLAATQFLLDTKRGYIMRVIMPYSNRLQSFARWNQQLVAESLGKTETHNPFPVAAIGTADQHSLMQQWMEGPKKAWHLFIREVEKDRLQVPKNLPENFSMAEGKEFGAILDAFLEGTSKALTTAKRAHVTISLTRLDAYHLGALFAMLLTEVVFLGKLYRIDAYGQPGVELSKKLTREILSRSAAE